MLEQACKAQGSERGTEMKSESLREEQERENRNLIKLTERERERIQAER